MKILTEQRRQELIEHCKRVMDESCWDGLEYPMAEIALASLTAAPVGYTWNRGINCEIPAADLNYDAPLGVNLYAAPPVPVIKLPEKKDGEHVYHGAIAAFNAGKSAGYNECIADIERINGIKDTQS